MTKKELLELLKDHPDETVIVLSSDGEGNSFSPLSGLGVGIYVEDTTWSGDFYDDPEDMEEYKEGSVPAVCLWPVN